MRCLDELKTLMRFEEESRSFVKICCDEACEYCENKGYFLSGKVDRNTLHVALGNPLCYIAPARPTRRYLTDQKAHEVDHRAKEQNVRRMCRFLDGA